LDDVSDDRPTLRTDRLLLRPVVAADRARLAAIQLTPEVFRWWGPVHDNDFTGDDDEDLQLSIVRNGEIIGLIQFGEELDPMYRSASIDMFLDPSVHRQGYGRESILAVLRHLIGERGHHRVTIDPSAENTAAIALYSSVGFRQVGVLREYERDPLTDRWRDGLLMDLLAAELP
jgi:aminoglycoside 6'-N-acetyltransferase